MTDQPTTPDNPATNRINAPWTADQVAALERFQTEGRMHPFTCGGDRHSMAPRLIPSRSGWHCPDPDCSYTQDWAHAFMAQPAAWPKPWPGQQCRLTAAPRDPEVERKAEERAAQAAASSEKAAAWLAGNQGDASLREQYAAAIRPTMLMGLQDAELDGPGGTQRINEWVDWIATELAEVRDREMEQVRASIKLLETGRAERSALLEEARDALEAAGAGGAHGDDWPRITPAIEELAARAATAERERDKWKWYADDAKRGTRCQRERAQQAEATIDRVKGELSAIVDEARGGIRDQLGQVLAALDQAQQPATTELREQANAWRRQANQRAFLLSRHQGLLVAIREFVAEETTPTNGWGDGYRDAKRDLGEILDAFAPDAADQAQQPKGAAAPLNP